MMKDEFRLEQKKFIEKLIDYIRNKAGKVIDVNYNKLTESNDLVTHSVSLSRCGSLVTSNFYVEDLLNALSEGSTIESIGNRMIEQYLSDYEENKANAEQLEDIFKDYEYLSDGHLMVKLFNIEYNIEYLKDKAYIPYLDLAVVFCYVYSIDDNVIQSIAIPMSASECWGVTLEEALSDTLKTMSESFKAAQKSLYEIVSNLRNNDAFAQIMNIPQTEIPKEPEITMITNVYMVHGAVTILYDDELKKFAINNEVEKVWIIPSSVHECLLLPYKEPYNNPDRMIELLSYINQNHVRADEVLSYNIYLYDLCDDSISIWEVAD